MDVTEAQCTIIMVFLVSALLGTDIWNIRVSLFVAIQTYIENIYKKSIIFLSIMLYDVLKFIEFSTLVKIMNLAQGESL